MLNPGGGWDPLRKKSPQSEERVASDKTLQNCQVKERSPRNRLISGIKKRGKNQAGTQVCKEARDEDRSPYGIRQPREAGEHLRSCVSMEGTLHRTFVTGPRGTGLSAPEAAAPRPMLKVTATQLGIRLYLAIPLKRLGRRPRQPKWVFSCVNCQTKRGFYLLLINLPASWRHPNSTRLSEALGRNWELTLVVSYRPGRRGCITSFFYFFT